MDLFYSRCAHEKSCGSINKGRGPASLLVIKKEERDRIVGKLSFVISSKPNNRIFAHFYHEKIKICYKNYHTIIRETLNFQTVTFSIQGQYNQLKVI